MGSCSYAHGGNPRRKRKTHWVEFSIWVYSWHPSHHQKKHQNWGEFAFTIRGATSSSNDQSPVAWLWRFPYERHDSHLENASTSIGGMHTSLLVPSALKIEEMILTLGPHRFLSVWT